MKHFFVFVIVISVAAFAVSCSGEDRSGEQPFAPTVKTVSAIVSDSSCILSGVVTASPNSSLLKCGFNYGTMLVNKSVTASAPAFSFTAVADSLKSGHYYAVAYATNGVGTSYGDTLWFEVP